jgi:PAS domain S-box-containing protein
MRPTLRESEDGFRSVAENAPEGILITYGFEEPYLFANRCASNLSGYSIEELLRIGPAHLVPPDEYPRIKQRMELRLAGQSVQEIYETMLLRKDGRVTPIEVTGSRITWQGRPAVLILVRDISGHKQMEAALERRVQERTAEWERIARTLEVKQRELTAHKQDLDRINKELVKTNNALSVLARNIDRRRDELEKKIVRLVSSKIMPVVEELRADRLPVKTLSKLDILSAFLSDLTGDGSKGHEVIVSLSPTELRVALMIKNGFNSEQIARVLHMSPHTVKTHRRSIRKKLKIQRSEVNLISYLRSKFEKEARQHVAREIDPADYKALESKYDGIFVL